jgi:predicted NAD/FAD-dependent oxidoreductase
MPFVQGLVQTLDKQEDKWHIKLEDGQIITTDCVVIAIVCSDNLSIF